MMRITWALALAALWPTAAVAQGEADRAALEALYHATGGDGWTDNTNWLSAAPLGDWHGVEVDEGRVTGLHLGGWDERARRHVGNGLTGSLPPELGQLSRLRRLEIAGNGGLTGPIPAEVGELADLEVLDLQLNWLTGPIPATIGRLGSIRKLWLGDNALSGTVPAEVGALPGLRALSLSGNLVSGPVPPELENLAVLDTLYLDYTMLSGPLPESMGRLSRLRVLDLEDSGLCVPPAMRTWTAAIDEFTGAECEGPMSFPRVATQLGAWTGRRRVRRRGPQRRRP